MKRIARPNTPRTTTSPRTPAPPAIENRSIKLDIISGQSFYRWARLSNRLPYNKMWISSRWEGRAEQGTRNKEQGKRQKERSDVGGRRAEVSRYEVRGTRGKRNTCPHPRREGRPPEPEQGTRNR